MEENNKDEENFLIFLSNRLNAINLAKVGKGVGGGLLPHLNPQRLFVCGSRNRKILL
jgi:hypothetical protein